METKTDRFPLRRQMQILLDSVVAPDGTRYSLAAIARATGIHETSIQQMLNGSLENPRLDNLRKLCRFYQITLDYFECESEEECRHFLAQSAAERASVIVQEIDQEAETLTPTAKSSVLRLLERFRILRGSGKH